MLEADFVVVGSGSAGSALAYRLSEDGKHSVIVIEYGGSDAGPFIQMPAALSFPMNMSLYDWGFATRARAASRRPRSRHAARQGDRRLVVDQRHGLCARSRPRLRPLGRARRGRLVVRRRAPLFQAHGERRVGGEDGWRGTDGPMHVRRGQAPQPALRSLRRGRPPGRFRDRPRTTTAPSRKVSARWSRPSIMAAAGRPPTPICGRR